MTVTNNREIVLVIQLRCQAIFQKWHGASRLTKNLQKGLTDQRGHYLKPICKANSMKLIENYRINASTQRDIFLAIIRLFDNKLTSSKHLKS